MEKKKVWIEVDVPENCDSCAFLEYDDPEFLNKGESRFWCPIKDDELDEDMVFNDQIDPECPLVKAFREQMRREMEDKDET